MEKSNGTEFELLTAKIQKELSPSAEVLHNQNIYGKSGARNQCDVVIKSQIGAFNFLGIIECKDFSKDKIGIELLREFKGKLEDIDASSGIYITTIGYTKEAIKYAKEYNIEIYTLFDASQINWSRHALLPLSAKFIFIKEYDIVFRYKNSSQEYYKFKRDNPINHKIIFADKLGNKYSIQDMFFTIWQNTKLFENESIDITFDNEDIIEIESSKPITLEFKVKLEHFKRILKVSLEEGRGFISENDFHSQNFKSSKLEIKPNELFKDSLEINENIKTFFELVFIDNLIRNPHYILPDNLIFAKNGDELKVVSNFKK